MYNITTCNGQIRDKMVKKWSLQRACYTYSKDDPPRSFYTQLVLSPLYLLPPHSCHPSPPELHPQLLGGLCLIWPSSPPSPSTL